MSQKRKTTMIKMEVSNKKNGFILFSSDGNLDVKIDLSTEDSSEISKLFTFLYENIENSIIIELNDTQQEEKKHESEKSIAWKVAKKYRELLEKEVKEIQEGIESLDEPSDDS